MELVLNSFLESQLTTYTILAGTHFIVAVPCLELAVVCQETVQLPSLWSWVMTSVASDVAKMLRCAARKLYI